MTINRAVADFRIATSMLRSRTRGCGGVKANPRQIVAEQRHFAARFPRYSDRVASGKVVAVVEDEETIREGICVALTREGCEPRPFQDGEEAWVSLSAKLTDLVVLDIGLPRMDGLELCRRLRSKSERLPIIFVTSREDEFDRVLGLEIGADDYLCKPFSMRELMARVKVLLRRAAFAGPERQPQDACFQAGDLTVDPVKLAATWKGRPVSLTVTEFMLVQALARRPGAVLTRDQLMDSAYPGSYFRERSDDRQSRQTYSPEVCRDRSGVLGHRSGLWRRLPLRRSG